MMRLRSPLLPLVFALAMPVGCDRGEPTNPPVAQDPATTRVDAWLAKFQAQQSKPAATEDVRIKAAWGLIRQGDYVNAIGLCDQMLAQNPAFHHARYFRAFANHKRKIYATARPDFEAVLDAGPAFSGASGAFYYYAWCCYYLGDLAMADAAFVAVESLKIDVADARYGRGLVAFERGELDSAERLLRESLALARQNVASKGANADADDKKNVAKAEVRIGSVLLQRAELDLAAGKPLLDEARALLESAVGALPQNEEAWSNLERVYTRLGEKDLAANARAKIEQGRKAASGQAPPAGSNG